MGLRADGGPPPVHNPTLRCIASRARRDVLRALIKRSAPLTEEHLVRAVIANEPGMSASESGDVRQLYAGLVHADLPALEDTNLISRTPKAGTIETTEHPALDDPRFECLLELDANGLDDVLLEVSHEYRRVVLTTLRAERSPLSIPELSNVIVDSVSRNVDPTMVTASLHHSHLPRLAHGHFIEYDTETGYSTYTAHPVLEDVFTIIYEPDEYLTNRFDGFLGGLHDSITRVGSGNRNMTGWPHHWSESPNG